MTSIRLVIIADTHGLHEKLAIPDGDILIHAGDLTLRDSADEVAAFNEFLGALPHPEKIVIAGNHDFYFEREPRAARALMTNCTYLEDEAVTVRGIKFYGSPWQPRFFNWAFNLDRGPEIARKWALIPDDTDVLITHGPPAGFGDKISSGKTTGCEDLAHAVRRIGPRLHIFGHIHEDYGRWSRGVTTYINGSSCDLNYRPVNPPQIFEW